MFRFLHSSDLHLGKRFGGFPDDVSARLRDARVEVLRTLARLARENGAAHVLLAGDTFDQMTPAPRVIRQALNTMGSATDITWGLMPGNHDHANATELWRTIVRDAPANVMPLLRPEPVALTPDVTLLPAPPTERHPGRDLTEWFNDAATGDTLRIGLAHGSIRGFSAEDGGASILSPDRVRDAGLAYLGLGDWHGQLKVTETTWYSGAPEADSFKHAATPSALLVEVGGQGTRVTPLSTAQLIWQSLDIEGTDPPLPPLADRDRTLLSLAVSGLARPAERLALEAAFAQAAPDFLWARADFSRLAMAHDTNDLDEIDRQGALRAAADALASDIENDALAPEDRKAARAALSYLFTYAAEAS